jgi:hypothetical protein
LPGRLTQPHAKFVSGDGLRRAGDGGASSRLRPVLRTGIRRTTHEVPVARARSPIGVVGPDARTSGKSSGMSAEDEGRSVTFEREKR